MNATANSPAPNTNGGRARIMWIIAAVFVVIGIAWWIYWLLVLSVRETTEDAYVGGNKVIISAQVPGTVMSISADNTQLVKAGQVLVQLDPTDAASQLDRATAALALAVRAVHQQSATADQYGALIDARRRELERANTDLVKREPLLAQQAIAPEEIRHARDAVELARAALEQARRQSQAARAAVEGVDVPDNPTVLQARAAYVDAWINAQRNAIVSPVTGYVAERSAQLGQRVAPGQSLMTVVPLNALWVDANFKESQLRHLRIGQPATIDSDLYGGGVEFHGRVVGMAAGTGAAFSLLPAQNASGNWIKVVQRVPVRIEIDPRDLAKYPLRVGLSTTVKVDTHDRSGSVLPATASSRPIADTDVYARDREQATAAADAIIARNLNPGH
ncbi:MAG: efflux RND transporter periplasmic adaptor subunit [Proteobacteria bacterium]|nr:efflux RND transporter periplasmic adaptor subunit [Pseudomonadota bacterium]